MQKSKNATILFLIIMFSYFLFSQFYLKTLGNTFVYIINPLFFIILALGVKILIPNTYNSKKHTTAKNIRRQKSYNRKKRITATNICRQKSYSKKKQEEIRRTQRRIWQRHYLRTRT